MGESFARSNLDHVQDFNTVTNEANQSVLTPIQNDSRSYVPNVLQSKINDANTTANNKHDSGMLIVS